jgi:Rrf2 family protein
VRLNWNKGGASLVPECTLSPKALSRMITQRAKYALHALLALAKADTMMIGEIARSERIPRKFLEQILLDLKRHGIVQSRRGRGGGYSLLMPSNRITFGQVFTRLGWAHRALALLESNCL